MRSKSSNNQIYSMKVDPALEMSFKNGSLSGGRDSLLPGKSLMSELKQEALFAKYKERSNKQNNMTATKERLLNLSPSPGIQNSLPTSKTSTMNSLYSTSQKKDINFDKNKIEINKNIILPMPQVSINYLTKTKMPTNIKSRKRGSYHYIEVDKKKFNETMKYMSQQNFQAAERTQPRGSIKLRQRQQSNISTPQSRRAQSQSLRTSIDLNNTRQSIHRPQNFEDSLSKFNKQNTFTPKNQERFEYQKQGATPSKRNMDSSHDSIPSLILLKTQNQNDFRRSSFFRRESMHQNSPSSKFANDMQMQKRNSALLLPTQHVGRPSQFLSTFSSNLKEQAKGSSDRENILVVTPDEQETATSVKNQNIDFQAFIKQRLGSTRRSSNISFQSDSDPLKSRSNSFLFRTPGNLSGDSGADPTKSRESFFTSIPFNQHSYEAIQKCSEEFKQDVMKNMTENKFLDDLKKQKEKRINKDKIINKDEAKGFKQFAINHFKPNSLDRLKTFFSFAFTSVDKGENKQITSALNEILENQNPLGTMQIIDLWSAKSLKNCIERTNMSNERFVIQQYLYYKAKYDSIKKEEKKQQIEQLSRQKEETLKSQLIRKEQTKKQINEEIHNRDNSFIIEDDSTQYIHNQKMLMNSSHFNLRYKRALNTIIEEIKDMRQENIEDIKNQKLQDKIQRKIQSELDKKYKFSKIFKKMEE